MFVKIIDFSYIQHTYTTVVISLMCVIMFRNSLSNLAIVSYTSVCIYLDIIMITYILYNQASIRIYIYVY